LNTGGVDLPKFEDDPDFRSVLDGGYFLAEVEGHLLLFLRVSLIEIIGPTTRISGGSCLFFFELLYVLALSVVGNTYNDAVFYSLISRSSGYPDLCERFNQISIATLILKEGQTFPILVLFQEFYHARDFCSPIT